MENNVIEMHATWLTINSIIGCTNGCKYCFLQTTNKNICKPIELLSPQKSVEQLLKSSYYNEKIPICLLPNTDVFLNKDNIDYLKRLLLEIKSKNIPNVITTITKCIIPQDFIEFINDLNLKEQLIFYLSYSGLGKEIEPNVKIEDVKENFKNLHKNNYKIIHYFRPIIPQNGSPQKIKEILNYVNNYTNCSVITGLKLKEEYFDKIDFWKELRQYKEEGIKAEGVWPEEAYNYFYKDYDLNQNIYQTNSCALANIINISALEYYETEECKYCNICSEDQRELCKKDYKKVDYNKLKERIIFELKKINKYTDEVKIDIYKNIVIIKNINLEVGDLAYLTYSCNFKITTETRNDKEKYFNSSLNGSKPLVLRRENGKDRRVY